MTERWLRWYDGTARDGKLRLVAEWVEEPVATVLGVWASLLEDAATSDPRGTATKGLEYHSMYLDLTTAAIQKIWNAMERAGTVRNAGNGDDRSIAVLIINWDKRQFETDAKDPTAKDRKEKWKQKHKTNGTLRNGLERFGTPETETETDKNIVLGVESGFTEFYLAYPKKKSRKRAEKAYATARKEATHAEIMAGLDRAKKSDSRFRDPQYTPMPAAWLNGGGWTDELEKSKEDWRTAIV